MKKTKIELLLVIAVILVTTVPFVNKAFHIDDGVFLDTAKEIRQHPLRPYSAFTHAYGVEFYRYEDMPHPPLFIYLLSIFPPNKTSEPVLHIFSFLFAILAGISAYFLMKRFTRHPLFATLFFICSPMFIVSSHNIMTDIPAMAFCLVSIATFLYGIERSDTKILVLASILIGIAFLIRYINLVLFPLILLYSILYKKSIQKTLFTLLVSFLIFLIWPIHNLILYKKLLFLVSGEYVFHPNNFVMLSILQRGTFDLSSIGGTTIFPVLLLGVYLKNLRGKVAYIFIASLSIFIMLTLRLEGYTIVQKFLLYLFLSTGIFVTYKFFERIVRSQGQQPDAIFLSSWYIIVLLITVMVFPFGCTRYMLLLLFPLAATFINEVEKAFENRIIFHIFCFVAIFLTFVSGLSIAFSDYEYANVYRSFAKSFPGEYDISNRKTWFSGEWGFRYYMEKEGFSYLLTKDNSPREGDIVVIPAVPFFWEINSKLRTRMELVGVKDYKGKMPIKVMSQKVHAGLYGNAFGLLPYSFSTDKLESFRIYRVIK